MDLEGTDAWIFDLDGVLTDTASLHERAWAELFEGLFDEVRREQGVAVAPFTGEDYRRLVDGEARMDGVRHVLADRGITRPEGAPADPAGTTSVCALARQKDERYVALLEDEGPRPYASSVDLLHRLRRAGVDVAVVSASRHCAEVLRAAGLEDLADVVVDGVVADRMGLAGKPDPALFVEAARRLGVPPARAVVVEDALAGVEAGRRGGFGVVIGVDRAGQAAALRAAGADLVVADLGDLRLKEPGPAASPWQLTFEEPSPDEEGAVESLCAQANGYLGTRAARPWAADDGTSYPGTYLAGVYDRLTGGAGGEAMEVESLVNAPNWLPVRFRADGGSWLGEGAGTVSAHRVRLSLREGLLVRRCVVTDDAGHRTAVVERRLVSMDDPHLVALELSCVPLNWEGSLELRAALDATVRTDETVEDRLLPTRHLALEAQGGDDDGAPWLQVRTVQSGVTVAMASRCALTGRGAGQRWRHGGDAGIPAARVTVAVEPGTRTTVEKVVAIYTSRDRAISEPGLAAASAAAAAPAFDELLVRQRAAWALLWRRAAITLVDGERSSTVVNRNVFHVLQVASPHVADLDAGVGARGLHGEGYRGHVFWDLLFVLPVLNFRFPEVSRSLLAYRARRLPAARRAAAEAGLPGALFPWQSGSDGRDETPTRLFNPRSGRWMPDRSRFQRHVGLAIAYEVCQYWQITGDTAFLTGAGSDLIVEIARAFAGLATWDAAMGRYHIAGVVGPDEFHDGYPWRTDPGITDNAYTNVMAAWVLSRACELWDLLRGTGRAETVDRLALEQPEVDRWDEISRRLHVPFHDGVISQFDGYQQLEPFDFDAYRGRYGDIGRLDLILEAEGDSVNRYQVGKQADVLMLLYLLSAEELRDLLARMGYPLEPETIRRTIAYYESRVSHGSTLSTVVHSWVLARADRQASWHYLQEALASDGAQRNGTTREGIHLGAMAGTVDILQRCYTGLEVRGGSLRFDPLLPSELGGLQVSLTFRGADLRVDVDQDRFRLEAAPGGPGPVRAIVSGQELTVQPGRAAEVVRRGS